jgi:hypothetical protein
MTVGATEALVTTYTPFFVIFTSYLKTYKRCISSFVLDQPKKIPIKNKKTGENWNVILNFLFVYFVHGLRLQVAFNISSTEW